MKWFVRLTESSQRLIDAIMALMMVVMIVMVFANVVLRYGFASGILGSIEISRFLFVWIVMLGAIGCLSAGEHLRLLTGVFLMPPRLRRVVLRAGWALIVLCCAMLTVGSLRQTLDNWSNAQPMSGISVGLVYLAGVVGGGAMTLIALYRLWRLEPELDRPRSDADASAGDLS